MGEGGHEKGINCIDFYTGSDRPFLVTGSDDHTVRVWDYHSKSCVRVLEGHANNVSAVIFHPQLPFLLSAGEDGNLRIWNAQTFRPEASYNFGMERAWGLACCRAHNAIGLAFDSGTIVFQLGRGDPCASLDPVQGRLVWSRARGSGSGGSHGNEILTGMVRLLDVEGRPIRAPADSEVIPLTPKELGTSDVFPQNLLHSPDGRLVAVWGDEEYVIYSTIGWRNRAFGKGVEIAWAAPGGDVFAVRNSTGRVTINRVSAHDQGAPLQGVNDCDRIYGGPLLGISSGSSSLSFFDWTGEHLIRTIDVAAVSVSWSPDASHVAIQTDSSCYILSANAAVMKSPQSFSSGEDGIEDSVELVDELELAVKSVVWISGNCFVYLTEENRLAYHVVGGDADESFQLALFDKSQFLLGFLPGEQRVYLTDQDLQVTSYAILPSLINFQSTVLCGGDLTGSMEQLKGIPSAYHARLAVFLQRRGYLREALEVSPDAHFQFDLAVQLSDLQLARELLSTKMAGSSDKWQELGRVALQAWNLPIAEEALTRAGDLASLFLLYAAAGDVDGLVQVAREAAKKPGNTNLAFAAFVKAGAYVPAFELLLSEGRPAEAALFARTYGLSAASITKAVEMWRVAMKKEKIAGALADPLANPDKFENVRFDGVGLNVGPGAITPRGRSVSFDGNVSVAGTSSTISLKPAFEEDTSIVSTAIVSPVENVVDAGGYLSDDQMSMEVNTAGTGTRLEDLDEDLCGEEGQEGCGEEPEYESSIVQGECGDVQVEAEDVHGDDEYEETGEYAENTEQYEQEPQGAEYETEPKGTGYAETEYEDTQDIVHTSTEDVQSDDALLEELTNLRVDEEFNNGVLGVVEGGADVYDIVEAEYPVESLDDEQYPAEVGEAYEYQAETAEYISETAEQTTDEHTAEHHAEAEPAVTYEHYPAEAFEYPVESVEGVEGTEAYEYHTEYQTEYPAETSETNGYFTENTDNIDHTENTYEHIPSTDQHFPKSSPKEKDSDDEIDFGGDDADGWL